jgi:L-asparagine transporter-like permease
LLFDTEFWSPTIAIAGLAILLAVALAAILFGYIADEEAKGRRIEWLEEPLALGGEPEKMQEAQLRKAA